MSNTILVTAASGNIGRPLVAALKTTGASVIVGSSSGKSVDGLPSRRVDFTDPASLEAAFTGIDTLFLLLPLVPEKVTLAQNAVAAAKAAGVKQIVRSSGAGADPHAGFALPRLQGEIDQIIIDSGIAYTLVRPATFMQNFANHAAGMIKGGAYYMPQGEGKVSFIDVRDIAAVTAEILLNPAAHQGQAYTLTGAVALSNAQAMQMISDVIGKPVAYVAVPDDAAISAMKGMGMGDWLIDQLMSLNRLTAAGYAAGTTDTVRHILGRDPIGFAQFAADHKAVWL